MIVLLVEDDRDLAANIGEFLESAGHRVDYASNGLLARRLCSENRYDAIVLDVGLPGASGLDVCRWLRSEARRSTPVLMLTARDLEADILAGFEAGADDYLVKPCSLRVLAARPAAGRGRKAIIWRALAVITDGPAMVQCGRTWIPPGPGGRPAPLAGTPILPPDRIASQLPRLILAATGV